VVSSGEGASDAKGEGSTLPGIRWDAFPETRISATWTAPDFESETFRRGEAEGLIDRFSARGWRTFVRAAGGSGFVDRVMVRDGVQVSVVNCILPALDRRVYDADEPLILLYASLSCDLTYHVEGQPPIVLNGPELTLVHVPRGLPLTIDIKDGVRQQRMFALFRRAEVASFLRLDPRQLPSILREAADGTASFGRIVSLPLSHHVASLVADTIDTPLPGELRALQYEGRLIELLAFAIDAIGREPARAAGSAHGGNVSSELAHRAMERLSREYRRPPDVDALARKLCTNANKLRASFKTAFGVTMNEYCLDRRMREAQQLLLQGRLSISQIGERVGYEYPSGFTAAFTRHVGMTPRQYRRHRAAVTRTLRTGAAS
jgi:AraC-like DNA-binding protein